MADGPSAEDATANELGDGDTRVTRERHKRPDASAPATGSFSGTGQDAAKRVHEDANASYEAEDDHRRSHRVHHRVHHYHQHHPPRQSYHHPPSPHHQHQHCNPHRHLTDHRNDNDRVSSNDGGGGDGGGGGGVVVVVGDDGGGGAAAAATATIGGGDSSSCVDATRPASDDDEEASSSIGVEAPGGGSGSVGGVDGGGISSVGPYHGDVNRTEIVRSVATTVVDDDERDDEDDDDDDDDGGGGGVDSDCGGDSGGSSSSISNSSKSGAGGVAMTGGNNNAANTRGGVPDDAPDVSSSSLRRSNADGVPEVNDHGDADATVASSHRRRASVAREEETEEGSTVRAAAEVDAAATTKTDGNGGGGGGVAVAVARHQGSPFKGQVRMAEDTLVGPCGKKRCADRYDSSESSDSGVAVSCGECSSSGTSDITEPGSPCSTSSDEGVAIRGTSASPLPSLPKLAASQIGTRPQWPWTPPLAATACFTYKRLRGEPEAGALARSGAVVDPTSRSAAVKANGKTAGGQHHHESQGKITEYFKTQIKPQQPKIKKTSEAMSVLVAKSASEFRRPPTVQRNKGGLAKYLGTNSRGTTTNDWEMRTLTMSPPAMKKPPLVVVPRTNSKMDKKLPKPLPSLPISNDVLKNMPNCKISSLRLTSDTSLSTAKCSSPPSTATPSLLGEPIPLDFKGCILSKSHVNENNNLMNGCGGILGALRSQGHDPISRLSPSENSKVEETQATPVDEDDVDEEEEDSRSSESKPSLSPILSAPTTIRFPARAPEKGRSQATDSGNCRWDKCGISFESVGGLLEHLQAEHINTQTGGDNFVCQWQGCKVQGRTSCSRRWLERHVLSHGGNKPFRCIVDGCGCRFSSQTALERHVNGHFNQPETSSSSGRRSCENGGKLVRRNGKKLRYRRQPWSARVFDYFDSGVMEGLQHRLLELATSRTQGRLAETPGNSMALTSQVLARRVEMDGKTKVLLRWYPQNIEPDEWVLESEVQSTKHVGIRKAAASNPEEVSLALYPAISGRSPPTTRIKQRRKPVKNS